MTDVTDVFEAQAVGSVEILVDRVYPLDPECRCDGRRTVYVQAGSYPVYRDFDAYFWVMTGRINARGFFKIGDGMFAMISGDSPVGPEISVCSKRFGVEDFAEFQATDPACVEGPSRRLVFTLDGDS